MSPDDYLDLSLAPCPKCGNRAEFREDPPLFKGYHGYFVVCEYNCVRQVSSCGTKAAAAANWNRGRKLPEKLDEILRKAQESVREFYGPTGKD